MTPETGAVLRGEARWAVEQADCLAWLRSLPEGSVDLLICSPPYQQARLYLESGADLGIARDIEEWVAWMVEVCEAARHACKGLCAFVVEGQTSAYRYNCTPFLLMADLHRRGFHLRKPPVYRRVGIPGSGGPDWWRNDWEPVVCFTQGGRLPWSDNTATGHPPKWAPGGEMSHRLSDGTRVNQWGGHARSSSQRTKNGDRQPPGRPSHEVVNGGDEESVNLFGEAAPAAPVPVCPNRHGMPNADDTGAARQVVQRPTHVRQRTGPDDGEQQQYAPPVLANPGNVIDCNVGGGQMGSRLASENEAPFPEQLVGPFVLSFCPPGGLVCDPFSGSGTTGAVAVRHGRRFVGCDLRQSQVDLSRRRLSGETPPLFPDP